MKVVVKNDEYTIYQRRDGRYAVEGADKKPVNGDEKVAILVANELIAVALPAAPEEEGNGAGEDEQNKLLAGVHDVLLRLALRACGAQPGLVALRAG